VNEALPNGSADSASVAARHVAPVWGPERSELNLARVLVRRARRRALGRLGGGAILLLALASFVGFFLRKPAALPTAVAPLAALPVGKSPKTTFADGSVARVSDDGELVVKVATALHIESVLASGAADFEVTKHPERDFVIVAGPVRVRVVGTRFRVERSGERTRVSVSEGKVEVQEGDARSYLEAGESRFFPSQPAPVKDEPRAVGSIGARARFLELARGGEFKAAYQIMSQSPAAVGSRPEELLLAADAARLSNHPEQALGYLRRVTSEHAGDSRAPLAAFTLGRVLLSQLSRPAEAAEAFALARRLRPSGSLAEDALAREAEARAAAGSAAQARALAQQYVARYPQGKHLSTLQRLATAP
jgi:transmembrane sensor